MIKLYAFGPVFGLPDPSPFVLKTHVQLQMSGLDFELASGGPGMAPKGKLPFIDDDGTVVGDSTLIRDHLEAAHGVDFDAGLDGRQKATAWAVEKMLEEHLYWAIVLARWADDVNFAKGPSVFFNAVPEPARDQARAAGRERVLANSQAHGLGRHSPAEIDALSARSLGSLAEILGGGPYLIGDKPCGADATAFAFVAAAATPFFETRVRRQAESHPNLMAYRDRLMGQYFPAFA
jgi:glutathione S-transferase